jgi:hypothetical protein
MRARSSVDRVSREFQLREVRRLQLRPWTVQEPRRRGTSTTESHYQVMASEGSEDFMCAIVTVTFEICKSGKLS